MNTVLSTARLPGGFCLMVILGYSVAFAQPPVPSANDIGGDYFENGQGQSTRTQLIQQVIGQQGDEAGDKDPVVEQPLNQISFNQPFGSYDPGNRISQQRPLAPGAIYPSSPKFVAEYSAFLTHDCLFFEEPLLERHGYSKRPLIDEIRSAKRFLGTAVLLPLTLPVIPIVDR